MGVPNTFANATTTIPLLQLDQNFATQITLGGTSLGLGNSVTDLTGLGNLSYTGNITNPVANFAGTISSVGTISTAAVGGVVLNNSGQTSSYTVGGIFSTNSVEIQAGLSGGVILTMGATSWAPVSDERLKTDLKPITGALEKLATLRTVTGRFKTDPPEKRRLFLIAQDVQKIAPEAVSEDKDGTLRLSYDEMIPVIIAAINEIAAELKGKST